MREWQMEANSCLKFYSRDNCVLGTVMACRREGAMGEGRLEGCIHAGVLKEETQLC